MRTIKSSIMAKAKSKKLKAMLDKLNEQEIRQYALVLSLVGMEKGLMTLATTQEAINTIHYEMGRNQN